MAEHHLHVHPLGLLGPAPLLLLQLLDALRRSRWSEQLERRLWFFGVYCPAWLGQISEKEGLCCALHWSALELITNIDLSIEN